VEGALSPNNCLSESGGIAEARTYLPDRPVYIIKLTINCKVQGIAELMKRHTPEERP
jgi:hypothetical protein